MTVLGLGSSLLVIIIIIIISRAEILKIHFNHIQERTSMYYLKRDVMPEVYWSGLLR